MRRFVAIACFLVAAAPVGAARAVPPPRCFHAYNPATDLYLRTCLLPGGAASCTLLYAHSSYVPIDQVCVDHP